MARTSSSHIIQTCEGVSWLYNHRDAPAGASERKYRTFGLAIRDLLEAVEDIEINFGCEWTDQRGTLGCDGRSFKSIFHSLLLRCEQVLQLHTTIQFSESAGPRVVENIFWGNSAQLEIDELLNLVTRQLHTLSSVFETLAQQRQTNYHASQPLSRNAQFVQPSLEDHLIPPGVIARFRIATTRQPPPGYASPYDFPFQVGVNTLLAHLEQSTIQSRNGERQSVHQYLSLLKAQWLLQTIKSFPEFRNLRSDAVDRSEVHRIEQKILAQRMRPDITSYSPSELESLPTNHFFIWDVGPKNVLRDRMQPSGEEKIIMTADLPVHRNYSGCRLVVFRDLANKKGTSIRIVRQWMQNGQPLPPESNTVDCFNNIFRPTYIIAALTSQPLCVEISNPEGGHPELYEFRDLKDVFKLQWAITSYAVFSDFEDVDWAIARSLKSTIRNSGSRIQMWWYDPEDNLEKVAAEVTAPSSQATGHNSILSRMTGASGKTLLQDSESQKLPAHSTLTSKNTETEVIEAIPPYEPLLVIYSINQSKYEYICLKLHGRMFLDATACNCAKRPTTCLRSVIKSGNSGKCEVTRVSAANYGPRDLPNLALFARSYLKGMGPNTHLNQAEDVASRELVLDFPSARARQRFNQQFEFIIRLQRARESTQDILAQRAEYLTNKPRGEGHVKDRITGSIDTIAALNERKASTSTTFYHPQFADGSITPPRRDSALGSSPVRSGHHGRSGSLIPPSRPLGRVQTSPSFSDESDSSGSQRSSLVTPPPLNLWNPHAPYDQTSSSSRHPRTQSNASATSSMSQPLPPRPLVSSPSMLHPQAHSVPNDIYELPVPYSHNLSPTHLTPINPPNSYFPPRPNSTELEAQSQISPQPIIATPSPPFVPSISSNSALGQSAKLDASSSTLVAELDALRIVRPPPSRPSPVPSSQDSWNGEAGGRHVGESWL